MFLVTVDVCKSFEAILEHRLVIAPDRSANRFSLQDLPKKERWIESWQPQRLFATSRNGTLRRIISQEAERTIRSFMGVAERNLIGLTSFLVILGQN